jgi:hypothetical protein
VALFPKCGFQVLLTHGVVVAGSRLDGVLELAVPEDIPRAQRVELFFRSKAWVGYGSGNHRSVMRRDLFVSPVRTDLPANLPLAQGTYRFPFQLDIPSWLPPGFAGPDCAIEHVIEARLDVDWAIDPTTRAEPVVVMLSREGYRAPAVVRSPDGFHGELVVEVSLASKVVAQGEPVSGTIALRSGRDARFDAVLVSYASVATMRMAQKDRRRGKSVTARIPAERLRGGDGVPFVIPADASIPPTFHNGFIDHDVVLHVSVEIPWASDPSFEFPLEVLSPRSTVHGDQFAVPVGSERLQQISAAMAGATGLREGRAPVLAEGAVGPVEVRVADGPRQGHLGIDVDVTYPDVELGIVFRPLGMLDGFRGSPLLPEGLQAGYLLRIEPPSGRAGLAERALASFIAALTDDLDGAVELRLSDHHLGMHFALVDDEPSRMVAVALFARDKARAIADAIAKLPFPAAVESSRRAWEATAREHSAVLVPTGPSLHRLVFASRVVGGEERVFGAAIRTTWDGEDPSTRVDVDLGGAPLPKDACAEIANESVRLRGVLAVFPAIQVLQSDRVTLERPGFTLDPRSLLPGIELFLSWVIEARGERRAVQAYR